MSPLAKRLRWLAAVIGAGILACLIFAAWYFSSPRFHQYVRARVISNLEEVTGGRVELGSLSWKLYRLSFDLRDVTIHGREGPGEAPYAHVERLQARAKILSLFRHEIGLRALEIDRPQIHLIVYSDGTTNQPSRVTRNIRGPIERLFDLSLRRLEVRNGELEVNGRSIPFSASADDVAASMHYQSAGTRYLGKLHVGRIQMHYRDFMPVNSALDAEFTLFPASAEVTSLRWTSEQSAVQARGHIADFRNPRLELSYDATFDLAQLSRVARLPQVRGGTVQLKGEGSYGKDFTSSGTLVVRNLDYRDSSVRAGNANGGAQYLVSRDRLLIPHLFAHVFGGTVTGDAQIRNWTAGADAASSRAQQGTAHLQIYNMSIGPLASAISSPRLLLRDLHLAGTAAATTDLRWTGSLQNAEANILARISSPSQAAPGQLPVSGRIEAGYFGRTDSLRVTALDLSTHATRLAASGTMGRGAENLKLSLTTSNLGELQPAIVSMLGPQRLPIELRGKASFNGSVYGRVSAPAIAGHLEASDFDTLLSAGTQQGSAPYRARWDSVVADVLYSPEMAAARNGILRSGRAQFNFDFSAALQRGSLKDNSIVSAHLLARDAEIADLQSLLGYRYPVSGTMNASLALSGTHGDPRGSGRLSATKIIAYGEPVSSIAADVRFAKGEAQFSNINLAHNGARITGAGAYNPTTTAFRFDLNGSNFNLARVRDLQSKRLSVGGTMNFVVRASGSMDSPAINGNLHIAGLVLNGERAGDFSADAVTVGDEMRLLGRSTSLDPDLHLDGTISLRGDYPANLTLKFAHLDFDALLRAYLEGRVTGHSSAAGNIQLRGPLRHAERMDITGSIDQLFADVAGVKIKNDGPIQFRTADQVFRLERLRLLGEDTSVSASGTVQLAGAQRLDFRSDGMLNLKLLQSYRPEFASSGTVSFGVNVGGVLDNPQIQGQAQIANAALSYVDLPNGLSDVNGLLVFNRDRLALQSFTARTGGGTLNIGGFVTYGRTFGFNLTAVAHDVRLRYPAGISSMADANLTVTGSLRNATVAGDITVTKFGVNPEFDFAQYLARAKQGPEISPPNSPLNNIHLDLHVASTPELQVQTSLAKLSGDLDLRLRGTAAKPVVLGRVNVIEGDVVLNGAKYHMERGDVTFTNPVHIEPVLDIEATARVKEYDVTLGFHGPLDRLATTYRSDPPLPTADIIALLALGHTREETAVQQQNQPSFTEAASYAILGQALNAAVSSRVQRIFGVSRIKIDPQATSETGVNTSGPQLSIEQQVNNNITLTYITNLSQGNQQTIQLQYDINRNVSIIAIRDDTTGVVSFDVKIRQRRK